MHTHIYIYRQIEHIFINNIVSNHFVALFSVKNKRTECRNHVNLNVKSPRAMTQKKKRNRKFIIFISINVEVKLENFRKFEEKNQMLITIIYIIKLIRKELK